MSLLGINIASSSLEALDREMEVTGQNIANASTPGYSRQVAVLESIGPLNGDSGTTGVGGVEGGGVDVATVERTHAEWLDGSAATLSGQAGLTTADSQTAGQVQSLLQEPTSTGLQSSLTSFYNAFDSLANSPSDGATRDAAVSASQSLASRYNTLLDGLTSAQQSVTQQAQSDVQAANSDLTQIAALDASIQQASAAGNSPNELLDQRDQLVADLTQRTGAAVTGQAGGDLVISVAGATLLEGSQAQSIAISANGPVAYSIQGSGAPIQFTAGSLASEQNWANNQIPQYVQTLTGLGQQLATNVNNLLQGGTDANGNPGTALFSTDAQGHLSVSASIAANSSLLAAGSGAVGDGSVANAISALASGSSSIDPGYQSLVGNIGAAASASQTASQTAQAGLQQVQQAQASDSGVNLDQELANMVSLQQSYAASAQLLNTFNTMLNSLINSMQVA